MSIENAIINIMENNLDAMRANFSVALSEKAVQKLDERKREIAENYFGLNEGNPAKEGKRAVEKDDEMREKHMKKYDKIPDRLSGKLAPKFVARQEKKRKDFGQMDEDDKKDSEKLLRLDAKRRKKAKETNNPNSDEYRQKQLRHLDDRIMRAGRVITSKAKSYEE